MKNNDKYNFHFFRYITWLFYKKEIILMKILIASLTFLVLCNAVWGIDYIKREYTYDEGLCHIVVRTEVDCEFNFYWGWSPSQPIKVSCSNNNRGIVLGSYVGEDMPWELVGCGYSLSGYVTIQLYKQIEITFCPGNSPIDCCPNCVVCDECIVTTTTSSIRPSTVPATTSTTQSSTSTTDAISTTSILSPKYSISGTVRGDVRDNITIKITGTTSRNTNTNQDGQYMFSDLASGYYVITPDNMGYNFDPENYIVQNLTSDLFDMDFVSTKVRMPCVAEAIYGAESVDVELLRLVRDNFLDSTIEGRELIRLYYLWSPIIVKAMGEDENFKEEIRELIDTVLMMIKGAVK